MQQWMTRSVFSLAAAMYVGAIPVGAQQPPAAFITCGTNLQASLRPAKAGHGDETGSKHAPAGGEFCIGPEDVLDISVWGDAALSRVLPVRPDGKISLPLLDDVQAAGLTPTQLRDVLVEKFSEYVSDPKVSIIVREVHSFKVSVIGEVRAPGRYELRSRASVLDMLAQVGGFSAYASRSRIFILRRGGETIKRMLFDYDKVISADGSQQDFYLEPGDIVVVP